MYTIIISTVAAFIIAVLVAYFTSEPHGLSDKWRGILVSTGIVFVLSMFASQRIPTEYEVTKSEVYRPIVYEPGNDYVVNIIGKEITFSYEECDGKVVTKCISSSCLVSIEYCDDDATSIEITQNIPKNPFAYPWGITKVRIFVPNPHQWCGFF